MNVAISRAKNFLWIVGNHSALARNQNWKDLIQKGIEKQYNFPQDLFTKRSSNFLEKTLKYQKVQRSDTKKESKSKKDIATGSCKEEKIVNSGKVSISKLTESLKHDNKIGDE